MKLSTHIVFKFLGGFYEPLITFILTLESAVWDCPCDCASSPPKDTPLRFWVVLRIGLGPFCMEGIRNPPICISSVATDIVGGAPGTPDVKS